MLKRHPAYLAAARSLRRHPRATRAELLAFQSRALRRLIAHAYRRVPYYRELFDANGVRPSDIRTAADLYRIPVTTREELQRRPLQSLVAAGHRPDRLASSLTSGSSGRPLEIREAALEQHLLYLYRWRAVREHGRRWGEHIVSLGRAVPQDTQGQKRLGRFLRRCGLPHTSTVDALLEPDRIFAELRALGPDVLAGYPGVLARLAGEIRDPDRRALRPRVILSGGEVLTSAMRERIEAGWGAPVFESYASHECNLIGWECRHAGGLHACEDANVVEVLAENELVDKGESGEIVLTSLHHYAMPFIRYKQGDVVTRGDSPCSCGAPFATLREVQGRVADYLKLADGRLLHPFQLIRAFKDAGLGWLGEFQIAQRDANTIDLYFVPYATPPPDALGLIRASLGTALGAAVHVNVVMVREIPQAPGGKLARRPVYGARGNDFPAASNAPGAASLGPGSL